MGTEPADYCREIETYLCRKNDGHLIRVVGPSFELVSQWSAAGVPLKVAFRGIDRYFERYYRKGPRRRPVKIDFCEADVLDVFDEWRRALGLPAAVVGAPASPSQAVGGPGATEADGPSEGKRSLVAHITRAMERLTDARVHNRLGADADTVIDRVSSELDAARSASRGLRGDARRHLLVRLEQLDDEMLAAAQTVLAPDERSALEREAENDLAAYRETMPADAYRRAHAAAVARLVRDRFGLPTLTF